MRLNVSEEQHKTARELDESDLELLEWGAIVYDTLVEAKEDPYKHGRGFGDEAMAKARSLASRFHRGTVRAVSPRAFTQCLECGEELPSDLVDVEFTPGKPPPGSPPGAFSNNVVGTVKSTPLSRHLDESLCAFYVLMRVHRARSRLAE